MKIAISSTKAVFLSLFIIATTAGLVLLGLVGSVSAPNSATPRPIVSWQSAPRTTEQVREAYGQIPLSFEARGQAGELVNFRARGAGYSLSLSPTEVVLTLAPRSDEPSPAVLQMSLIGGNSGAAVEGVNELEGKVNYFIGNDPALWRTNIPIFGRVRYHEVYPGIDIVYYGNQRRLEYDFVVRPGRDARAIALEFAGAESVEVEAGTGDLLLGVGGKTIRQHKPVVYQEIEGGRREVEGRYALRSDGRVGFDVRAYDPSLALIIDPVLEYSTFLGGSGGDEAFSIAVDSAGNAYVAGLNGSTDFPTANPFQGAGGGGFDVFVTKLNAAGSAIVYSTYLGGSRQDDAFGIAVDSAGNAYVTGNTNSTNFPTANAFQSTFGGGNSTFFGDAFVTKLNPTGSALVYSTYLGGNNDDSGGGIVVDSAGNAYVTGNTRSPNFPTANALQSTNGGGFFGDAFVTKLNAAGSALVYSTYLGGSDGEGSAGIAVDSAGNAYVTGNTNSTNFPTANAFQSTTGGGVDDAFVTKLNPAGSALVYSTYLGGSGFDRGAGIAVDLAGNAYVTGQTGSTNFPTANPIQNTPGGAFVTKLNAAGSALVYSTYLGGSGGGDSGVGIVVDSAGNAYVTGNTDSTDFPTVNAFQSTFGGGLRDAFVTKLNAAGSALVYSTFLGGSDADDGAGIAVDSVGNAYVTGFTQSTCFPTTTGAFDNTLGFLDAFISKISETAPPSSLAPCPSQLLNIATRMRVLTGDSALIGGFIITGSEAKRVIIRGIGPSLTGIQGALANPTLDLLDSNQTSLGSNDDWISNRAEVEATTIPPTNDFESAIVKTLDPGAYTAVLRGQNNSTGVGVVEIYDLNAAANAILANISSRGFVDTGDNVMIAGLIIGGNGQANARVVVRGIGPSLGGLGITGALQDPILDLKDANGATLLSNDDWQQGQPTEITQLGLAPGDSRESALLISLPHGNFTAILRGKSNAIGVAVVEVYNAP